MILTELKNLPAILTVDNIKNLFPKMGKNTSYSLVHSLGFPKMKVGRKYYIVKNDFIKWLENQKIIS